MSQRPSKPIERYPAADLGELPAPPAGLPGEEAASPAAPAPAAPRPIATLDFVAGPLEVTVPLKHPFRHDGVTHSSIVVRPIQIGRIAEILARLPAENDVYDLYACMTGLPAEVLRALPVEDGEPVTRAAYDFLPPSSREASG